MRIAAGVLTEGPAPVTSATQDAYACRHGNTGLCAECEAASDAVPRDAAGDAEC